MLVNMRSSERITVTLPKDVADQVRATVEAGGAESVSGFVADVLVERFRAENVDQFLIDLAVVGGPVDAEARAWAEETIRLARGD